MLRSAVISQKYPVSEAVLERLGLEAGASHRFPNLVSRYLVGLYREYSTRILEVHFPSINAFQGI